MRISNLFGKTQREIPAEADTNSHQLLLRAGMIRQVAAGVYSYLPLAWRALKKIENIIRDEMDKVGGQELMMPVLQPLELWQRTGREYSIHNQSWPKWDKELARDEEITLVVQVNGKLRDRFTVPVSITEAEAWQLALDSEKVKPYIGGKKIVKTIYVPSKLVNLVVR